MLKIGWFSSGNGPASRDLLEKTYYAINAGEIPGAEISYVFCNREYGEKSGSDKFLDLVSRIKIPLLTASSAKFAPELREENPFVWRICYHSQLRTLLAGYGEDIRILAGYKLILDAETCLRKPTINLHPALPNGPKGAWRNVIWQLIKERRKESGITMHLVTPELDEGPVITFCRFPIWIPYKTDDLWKWIDLFNKIEHKIKLFWIIRKMERQKEAPMIIETLKLLARGRIEIQNGEIYSENGEILKEGAEIII